MKYGQLDLRLGDCMEVMRGFPDGHFDLAIVDPPYGLGASVVNSGGVFARYKTDKENWDMEIPSMEYFAELRRVSRNQVIWGGNYFPLPPSQCFLVWDKVQTAPSFAQAEMAWTSFERVAKLFTYRFSLERNRIHPTQKPVALYSWVLREFAEPGQRILDTHLGSGSHAIACHYFGANLTACEIDADYFAAASARVKRETAQEAFF
jgi:site-specific DNA-methyltransferase (adenine-specific)